MNAMLVVTTLVSLGVAVVMGVLAWRMAREERRRSDARVDALVASLDADPPLDAWESPVASEPELGVDPAPSLAGASPETSTHSGMFAETGRDESSGARRLAVIGLAVAALFSGVTIAWTTARALAPSATTRAASAVQPLELLSLTSMRRGQELVVAGLVRNPRTGERVERVNAVVLFFDERGGFLTSSRAPLDVQALAPGEESPFQLTLAAPEGTTRYRVSFRHAEGGVVPHVDRRSAGKGTAATTAAQMRQAGL